MSLVSLQTAIDILTTVVRNTKPPLSQLLICQAFPAVAQCTLHTDDNATMQVPPRWGLSLSLSCGELAAAETSDSIYAFTIEVSRAYIYPEDPGWSRLLKPPVLFALEAWVLASCWLCLACLWWNRWRTWTRGPETVLPAYFFF